MKPDSQRRLFLQLASTASLMTRGEPALAADVQDGSWADPARLRSLPWRLRVPATPGPWPLVLYSHGLGGNREGAVAWGEAWAAAGMAVMHLQHPGSDTLVLRDGLRGLKRAASAEQLIERVRDVRFVLDEMRRQARSGEPPWQELRQDAIGLAGHSFGALTTQAIAGQRFAVRSDLADPRPRAFVALSPAAPRDPGMSLEHSFGAIARPFMAVTGSLDGDPFGSFDSGQQRARVYTGLPAGQRALLWLDGADHMSFSGGSARPVPNVGPFRRHGLAAEREGAHQAVVARITAAWWRAHLLDDDAAMAALRQAQGLSKGDRLELG